MRSISPVRTIALAAAVLLVPVDVASAPPAPAAPTALFRTPHALSVGAPNAGSLVRGSKLETSDHIRVVPDWNHPDYRWGLPELVQMLQRAAHHIHEKHGPCRMSVGDLSCREGGSLRKHRSHQSGRDVDIAFYMVDRKGKPLYHSSFVAFGADGRAINHPEARFDDTRNWALVATLLSDPKARVQQIFVSNDVRKRLLIEAERQQAPRRLRLEAARVLIQPSGSSAHADHFHVRIACPPNQRGACESWPRSPTREIVTPDQQKPNKSARGKRRRAGTEG
ncbi:MAG TPA: penicillin-insensitive murein endopeptidase [Polyangiaceae bacterium]|nr:penicillin-insensitive murein endopeptidase [Polyangiaceae bacterium]HNZ23480.1 penicillin-insensitive murein endopeptidase [Polyangiaceae bacterium]HOD23013.1 penicillin-insensitive murein endopeptidase [Polyangiaceae bacterium]HOE51947.1 penicillin-insensitive murein endopeptidase [Polyangiaceae bacterium]HOH01251.1 penicillin-insensitive murein endopeptidase [Polyangiaceae bacterium]